MREPAGRERSCIRMSRSSSTVSPMSRVTSRGTGVMVASGEVVVTVMVSLVFPLLVRIRVRSRKTAVMY